jgi:uncharacterized protein YajQ (UPF0234 family)
MASFDIVSKVDPQSLDNAINSVKRELQNRYDFRGSNSDIELDKKNFMLHLTTEHEMKMEQIEQIILEKMIKNKLDPNYLDLGKEQYAAGKNVKKDIEVRQGLSRETAKKIVKAIKESKIKVQVQIMDDQVRCTSKKLNDLQAVIAMCRKGDFDVPLQYINMK